MNVTPLLFCCRLAAGCPQGRGGGFSAGLRSPSVSDRPSGAAMRCSGQNFAGSKNSNQVFLGGAHV